MTNAVENTCKCVVVFHYAQRYDQKTEENLKRCVISSWEFAVPQIPEKPAPEDTKLQIILVL